MKKGQTRYRQRSWDLEGSACSDGVHMLVNLCGASLYGSSFGLQSGGIHSCQCSYFHIMIRGRPLSLTLWFKVLHSFGFEALGP